MTGELSEFPIGAEGLKYLKDQLTQGKTLSHALLRRPDLDLGRLFAFLPSDTPQSAANRLTESASIRSEHSVRAVANMVAGFLRDTEQGICIFENSAARSSDAFLSRLATPFVTLGDEVFHVVASSAVADVEETMAWAESAWQLVGVLSVGSAQFARREAIEETAIVEVAERAHRIILSAYDGEGYLIWVSPRHP